MELPGKKLEELGMLESTLDANQFVTEFDRLMSFVIRRHDRVAAVFTKHAQETKHYGVTYRIVHGDFPEFWICPEWVAIILEELGYEIVQLDW